MKTLASVLLLAYIVGCRPSRTIYRPWDGDSESLKFAIQLYFLTTGEIPSTEQGFEALIERPKRLAADKPWKQILDHPLKTDPWGNPYKYRSFGGDPPEFEIRGLGPDGILSEDDYVAKFTVDK